MVAANIYLGANDFRLHTHYKYMHHNANLCDSICECMGIQCPYNHMCVHTTVLPSSVSSADSRFLGYYKIHPLPVAERRGGSVFDCGNSRYLTYMVCHVGCPY